MCPACEFAAQGLVKQVLCSLQQELGMSGKWEDAL